METDDSVRLRTDGGSEEGHHHGHGGDRGRSHDHNVSPDDGEDGGDRGAHDHHSHDLDEVGVAVVTVSSSRTVEDDPSGAAIATIVEESGHEVVVRDLIDDDYDGVQDRVNNLVNRDDVNAVVTTGGTGVTPDDVTIEAVEPLFGKVLPGFGELFRALSREDIGTRVVATRATAGVADGVPVFCLPGSADAVRLGTQEIVIPEVGHLAGLARRPDEG